MNPKIIYLGAVITTIWLLSSTYGISFTQSDVGECGNMKVAVRAVQDELRLMDNDWFLYQITKDLFQAKIKGSATCSQRVVVGDNCQTIRWKVDYALNATCDMSFWQTFEHTIVSGTHFRTTTLTEDKEQNFLYQEEELRYASKTHHVYESVQFQVYKYDLYQDSLQPLSTELDTFYQGYKFALVGGDWTRYLLFRICNTTTAPALFVVLNPSVYNFASDEELQRINAELNQYYKAIHLEEPGKHLATIKGAYFSYGISFIENPNDMEICVCQIDD